VRACSHTPARTGSLLAGTCRHAPLKGFAQRPSPMLAVRASKVRASFRTGRPVAGTPLLLLMPCGLLLHMVLCSCQLGMHARAGEQLCFYA
jgi:hypothetical protein